MPHTVEEEEELERCSTKLGPPKCEVTLVKLPKQVCVDIQHVPYDVPAPLPPPPAPLQYAAVHPLQPASLPYLG